MFGVIACGDDPESSPPDGATTTDTTTTGGAPASSSSDGAADSTGAVEDDSSSTSGEPGTTGDPACPNLLADPGFEDGLRGAWSTDSVLFPTPLCSDACGDSDGPYSGLWWVWFGGEPEGESAHVAQTIVIPEGDASMSFYLRIPEAAGTGNDTLTLLIDGASVLWISDLDAETYVDYTQVWFDLPELGDGLEHEIALSANFPGTGTSSFYVDSISVTPCAPPR